MVLSEKLLPLTRRVIRASLHGLGPQLALEIREPAG